MQAGRRQPGHTLENSPVFGDLCKGPVSASGPACWLSCSLQCKRRAGFFPVPARTPSRVRRRLHPPFQLQPLHAARQAPHGPHCPACARLARMTTIGFKTRRRKVRRASTIRHDEPPTLVGTRTTEPKGPSRHPIRPDDHDNPRPQPPCRLCRPPDDPVCALPCRRARHRRALAAFSPSLFR